MEGIVKGLIYLHSRNVMHCDLNSNNVLIAKDNVAKITDFGLSRVKVQSRLSNNLANSGMGTVRIPSHI
jgi:serine/threonine protein kinase